jgi:predicted RNase H-like nuclease
LEAIFCENYNQAQAINLTNTGKSISKQSWFLSKKILEAREFSEKSVKLKEGHPECSFAEFEGKPLIDKKKSTRGLFKRIHILEQLGFRPPLLAEMLPESTAIGADDLVDATILCWVASKFYNGESKKFPSIETSSRVCDHDLSIYF